MFQLSMILACTRKNSSTYPCFCFRRLNSNKNLDRLLHHFQVITSKYKMHKKNMSGNRINRWKHQLELGCPGMFTPPSSMMPSTCSTALNIPSLPIGWYYASIFRKPVLCKRDCSVWRLCTVVDSQTVWHTRDLYQHSGLTFHVALFYGKNCHLLIKHLLVESSIIF